MIYVNLSQKISILITMENYETIYYSICRLCLCYSDRKKMVALIDENSQDGLTLYAKAVSKFANIIISKQDCFPSNMCSKCLFLLKRAIHFKFMAESNDDCLKQLKNSVDNDNQHLKEKIVEYTMLQFYFPSFKVIKNCLKRKNSSKEHRFNDTEIQLEKAEKVMENLINHSKDEIFDIPSTDTDTEKNASLHRFQVVEKEKRLADSNMFKSQSVVATQEVLENKESNPKSRSRTKKKRRNYLKRAKVCNICNKVMANQVTLRAHIARHNGGRFICEHCGKRYPVYNQLQIHWLTKHDTGPYLQCPHCPFKAPGKTELTEHKRIHTGERPFACDKCGLTFRRRAILRKHLVHHSEKTVQCPHCPKKFYLRSDMVEHSNCVHERLYVYLCSVCGVTYNKGGTVRQHMTKLHGIPREKQGKIARLRKGASVEQK